MTNISLSNTKIMSNGESKINKVRLSPEGFPLLNLPFLPTPRFLIK